METKMTVYNVIILDKSGSMSSIARQAVDGVNETIGSIKSAQEKNPDQEHTVTLVALTSSMIDPNRGITIYRGQTGA